MAQASRAEYVDHQNRLVMLFETGQSLVDDGCDNARRTNKMIKSLKEAMDVFLSKKAAFIEKGQFAAPDDQNQVHDHSKAQYRKYEKLCADLELLEPDPDRLMSKDGILTREEFVTGCMKVYIFYSVRFINSFFRIRICQIQLQTLNSISYEK